MLYSIQNIKLVYDTGDNPVLVECNDLIDYICKHNRGQKQAYKLFSEWMSHAFLEAMEVAVPTKALVEVKENHIVPSSICQPIFFKGIPTFATQFLHESIEWSQFNLKDHRSIVNKQDLMKIAFFDLWFANEDRNWNNFNLLTHPMEKGFEIVPIDHGACYNTGNFKKSRPLYQIAFNESLIGTEEFRKLVKPFIKNLKEANDFVDSLYLRLPDFERIYDEQVIAIPREWNIPLS